MSDFSDYIAMPEDFEDKRFAENNKSLFDEFIALVIRGVSKREAFALVFGTALLSDNLGNQRVFAIQCNPYYKAKFKVELERTDLKEFWSMRFAVHNLVKLLGDPETKDTAKLNAIKELNIIFGITVVDENGTTKMGRSMDDFYGKFALPGENPSGDATKH